MKLYQINRTESYSFIVNHAAASRTEVTCLLVMIVPLISCACVCEETRVCLVTWEPRGIVSSTCHQHAVVS